MRIWLIIGAMWMVVGLLSYLTIILVFKPTPATFESLTGKPEPESTPTQEQPRRKPFRLRNILEAIFLFGPTLVLTPFLLLAFSPFLLLAIAAGKICNGDK